MKKWCDLFAVAMTAKYSISIEEGLRTVANEADRNKAILKNLDHPVADRKCVSVLYLSLGAAARKKFTDKYPTAKISEITLRVLLDNCKSTFDTKPQETLKQFWHSLNAMACECDFGAPTESLVHDVFILNMKHLAVEEKLRTEPKATLKDALDFAIAYEKGTLRRSRTVKPKSR